MCHARVEVWKALSSSPRPRDAIARLSALPTLPAVLSKILDTASDPETSALDLGQYIAADQSLSATLLKLVNSAYYGFYREITSPTMAIVILGFTEVRNIVLAGTVFKTLGGSGSGFARTQLWRHSLATAIAAERYSRLAGLPQDGRHYTAGLLHDIGKVALDLLYPDQVQVARYTAVHDKRFVRETEAEVLQIDHTQAGGVLAERWNLPPAVTDAIQYHHNTERTTADPQLAAVTAVADHIAYEAGFGDAGNGRSPEYPEAAARMVKANQDLSERACEAVAQAGDRIDEFLSALTGSGPGI